MRSVKTFIEQTNVLLTAICFKITTLLIFKVLYVLIMLLLSVNYARSFVSLVLLTILTLSILLKHFNSCKLIKKVILATLKIIN